MIDLTKLVVTDDQPYFRFEFSGGEFFIYAWLEDDKSDVYKMCLAVPKLMPEGHYNLDNVMSESATGYYVNKQGGTKEFMSNVFLPKVNEYLSNISGGAPEMPTFPEDLDNIVQFNWIVQNSLSFNEGKVSLL
tara:strand:+ start:556 stop:954 length:399 start_codon:yes stop_codon:yes gene_type:complete